MSQIFFDNWETLFRTLIIGVLAYVSLVILLRISGRRTLSKMNAFDMVVTVALGSTLATILLNRDVALAEGVLAFALAVRSSGSQTFEHIKAVVLETDGSFSVVKQENSQATTSLQGIVVPGKGKLDGSDLH